MSTWAPAPPVGDNPAVAIASLLPTTGGYPVYNSAPLWVPAPRATNLVPVNLSFGFPI